MISFYDLNPQNLASASHFVLSCGVDDFPESTLQWARLLLLDTLGVCAASASMEAGVIGREVAMRLFSANREKDRARMLFDGRYLSTAGVMFASGNQTDNLDAHDGYNPAKGHIGVVTVPALTTLAEALPNLSGREALASLAVGYEIAGRAAVALHQSAKDYHTSGAWNALGVSAMAARLWRFTPEQFRQALGIAEYYGPRSQMMREIAHPTMLHDGSSMGGMVGIMAATMAQEGFTGAPAVTMEAQSLSDIWNDFGDYWVTEDQYIKPYPICRWAHAAIDGARKICQENAIHHQQIRHICINSFQEAVALYSKMPMTTSQAQYSLAFAVGSQIVHGQISLAQISGKGLSDPDVARLVAITEANSKSNHQARFPEGRWADVLITLDDGQELSSGELNARGGSHDPYNERQIIEKFHQFAEPVLGTKRARAIQEATESLMDSNSLFSILSDWLYSPIKAESNG